MQESIKKYKNIRVQELITEIQIPQVNYASSKTHSEKIDRLAGYSIHEIEKNLLQQKSNLQKQKQLWVGLGIQALQTPYSEILQMFEVLKPKPEEMWLDLGAGYGRLGFVLGLLHPATSFRGYEYVAERVQEGNRILKNWNLPQNQILQMDLASENFHVDNGDVFFIYDFGSQADVYKVIEKLRQVALHKSIRVIARGRGIRNWIMIDFPWLSQVNTAQHFENWSIFTS